MHKQINHFLRGEYSYMYLVDVGAHVAMVANDVALRQNNFWMAKGVKKHLTSQSKCKRI